MTSTQMPLRRTAYSPMFVTNKQRGYQLPALNIPSQSLASGTGIPEPQATPPAEEPAEPTYPQQPPSQPQSASRSSQPSHNNPASRGGLNGVDGASEVPSSQPQSPRTLDSPNPLRSHPTSTHSLSRQFQLDGPPSVSSPRTLNGTTGPASPVHNGRAPSPGPAQGLAQAQSNGSQKRPHTGGSTAANFAAPPHKRQHTVDSIEQPPQQTKRPLSVRKMLGLKALSNAFGRSSSEKKREDGAGGGGGGGVYNTHTGHTRNKSSDKLSLFSLSLSSRRPESRMALRPESRASQGPTLSRRRSSLMLLRGAFGLSVNEQPQEEARQEQQALEQQYEREQQQQQQPRHSVQETEPDSEPTSPDVPMRPVRTPTPPPMLPGLSDLKGNQGLHETTNGFFGDEDMFKDIQ